MREGALESQCVGCLAVITILHTGATRCQFPAECELRQVDVLGRI
jgi:hypothetical protein